MMHSAGDGHPYPGFFAIRESGMRESVCPVNMRSQSGQPCALCSGLPVTAAPWFDPSLLDNVARSPFYAGEDMKYVCYGLSSEAMWQGLMNERSDARRLRFARGASERRAWLEATL